MSRSMYNLWKHIDEYLGAARLISRFSSFELSSLELAGKTSFEGIHLTLS